MTAETIHQPIAELDAWLREVTGGQPADLKACYELRCGPGVVHILQRARAAGADLYSVRIGTEGGYSTAALITYPELEPGEWQLWEDGDMWLCGSVATTELHARFGRPFATDAGAALRELGLREGVHPNDVCAFRYASQEAAGSWAALNLDRHRHPGLGSYADDHGVVAVTDLRQALPYPTDPALPDDTRAVWRAGEKKASERRPPMASKAVPSAGNTGPRDFSAEVSSNITGRVPPQPTGAVYMEAQVYLAEEAAGAVNVQDIFNAVIDLLKAAGVDRRDHHVEALVVALGPEAEAAVRKGMGREP